MRIPARDRLTRLGSTLMVALAPTHAQTPAVPAPAADAVKEDIVIGSRVLAMLVRDGERGKSLSLVFADKSVVLMRGHGDVTVGPSVKMAVFRAYYTDVNARLQSQAIALGGLINYLTP